MHQLLPFLIFVIFISFGHIVIKYDQEDIVWEYVDRHLAYIAPVSSLFHDETRRTYVDCLQSSASGDVHDPVLSVSIPNGHPSGINNPGGKKLMVKECAGETG